MTRSSSIRIGRIGRGSTQPRSASGPRAIGRSSSGVVSRRSTECELICLQSRRARCESLVWSSRLDVLLSVEHVGVCDGIVYCSEFSKKNSQIVQNVANETCFHCSGRALRAHSKRRDRACSVGYIPLGVVGACEHGLGIVFCVGLATWGQARAIML